MLDTSTVRALSIDLDDTLWPIWPTIARAEAALRDWLHSRAPRAAAWFADTDAVRARRQRILDATPERAHDLSAIRRALIHDALQEAGEDVALAGGAFDAFFAERMNVVLFGDAVEALAFFAGRMPVIALSNGNADVHRIGIGAHFHASVSAQDFGSAKPDARIFHEAARLAGVPPAAVLHVGDDAALDVVGALAAGMQAVWLNREGQPYPDGLPRPHAEVADLHALCAWFKAPA